MRRKQAGLVIGAYGKRSNTKYEIRLKENNRARKWKTSG